jgi:hypothetical protein
VKRTAIFTEGDCGVFDLSAPDCPLLVHTQALGQKAPACCHGIVTNMQGPVVMGTCKHYAEESAENVDGAIQIGCGAP